MEESVLKMGDLAKTLTTSDFVRDIDQRAIGVIAWEEEINLGGIATFAELEVRSRTGILITAVTVGADLLENAMDVNQRVINVKARKGVSSFENITDAPAIIIIMFYISL